MLESLNRVGFRECSLADNIGASSEILSKRMRQLCSQLKHVDPEEWLSHALGFVKGELTLEVTTTKLSYSVFYSRV